MRVLAGDPSSGYVSVPRTTTSTYTTSGTSRATHTTTGGAGVRTGGYAAAAGAGSGGTTGGSRTSPHRTGAGSTLAGGFGATTASRPVWKKRTFVLNKAVNGWRREPGKKSPGMWGLCIVYDCVGDNTSACPTDDPRALIGHKVEIGWKKQNRTVWYGLNQLRRQAGVQQTHTRAPHVAGILARSPSSAANATTSLACMAGAKTSMVWMLVYCTIPRS